MLRIQGRKISLYANHILQNQYKYCASLPKRSLIHYSIKNRFCDGGLLVRNSSYALSQLYVCRTFNHDTQDSIEYVAKDASDSGINALSSSTVVDNMETFADYGLGGWLYPHKWLQNALEFLHCNVGLDWIPTIALLTVALRFLAIPTYIKMRQFNIRSHNHFPEQIERQMGMLEGNPIERQKKKLEFMEFLKVHQLNPIKPLLYSLPISAIFISFFAALRGIAAAKLPSFVNGGMLWFHDLTIADPYYILPLMACLSLHLLIRCGAATAEAGMMENIPVLKTVLLWSPIAFFPFVIFQPSCMFVFWLTSNTFSMILMLVMQNQKLKQLCNIPEKIVHSPSTINLMKDGGLSSLLKKKKQQAALREQALKKVDNHMKEINKFYKEKKN